jgi:Gpi18-like mannosyltransferase
MLSSKSTRHYYGDMYNDELMFLYLLIGIYQIMKNRPMLSSLFFSLSLSVKAGALLILPAFLG